MHDYGLEEMADAISEELRVDNAQVLHVLERYWHDKIAHVWQVADVLECAHRAGMPITEEDAVSVLYDVFEHLDSEYGITWTSLQTGLEEYHLDFAELPRGQWGEVHGVFKVWRAGDPTGVQFGNYPEKVKGNLTTALESAQTQVMRFRDTPIYIGCAGQSNAATEPWLIVLAKPSASEASISQSEE